MGSVLCPSHFTCCRHEQVSHPLYHLVPDTCNRDLVKSCTKLTILAWTQGTHNLGKVFTKNSTYHLDTDLNYLIFYIGFLGLLCFVICWFSFCMYDRISMYNHGSAKALYLSIHTYIYIPTYLPTYLMTQNSHSSICLWLQCTVIKGMHYHIHGMYNQKWGTIYAPGGCPLSTAQSPYIKCEDRGDTCFEHGTTWLNIITSSVVCIVQL